MTRIDWILKGFALAAYFFGYTVTMVVAPMWLFLRWIYELPIKEDELLMFCSLIQTGVISWLGLWLHQEVERRMPVTPPRSNQVWRRTEKRGPFIPILGVMIGLFGLFVGMASNDVLTFVLMAAFSTAIVMFEHRVAERPLYVAER